MLFRKKNQPESQAPMDLEAVMQKFDRESNVRVWEGWQKVAVTCILAIFSLFCIYVTLFATWLEELKQTYTFTQENALDIILQETGKVFAAVLEDAGVYKNTPDGKAAFRRFATHVNEA